MASCQVDMYAAGLHKRGSELTASKTDDKVQTFLDGLNGNEMERLLEMLKKM